MAATVTLSELQARVREAADMENSTFVDDTELTKKINVSLATLYDMLVAAYGEDYYEADTPASISTVAGQEAYDLPSTLYKLTGVNVTLGGIKISIDPYMRRERNLTLYGCSDRRPYYRLSKSKIKFHPLPAGVYAVELLYVPTFTKLVSAGDTFDGINGWEQWAVLDAAIACLAKEESSVVDLRTERAEIRKRIEEMRHNRDAGAPMRIIDVTEIDDDRDNGWTW